MIYSEPVVTFVASDAAIEDALPFLDALRRAEPGLRVLLIPRDPAITMLSAFRDEYGFEVLAYDFAAIDHLQTICFGAASSERGRLRLLAAFDVVAPAILHLDIDTRVTECATLLAPLQDQDEAVVVGLAESESAVWQPGSRLSPALAGGALLSTAALGIGGRTLGTGRMIRALRENLVTYIACRALQAVEGPVVNGALAALAVRRVAIDSPVRIHAGSQGRAPQVLALRNAAPNAISLDNGGSYRRSAGRIVGAPAWLAAEHAAQAQLAVVPPPALVARLRNVTVHGRGIVMTADGNVVRESLINADPAIAVSGLARRPVTARDVDGPVVLLKQAWDNNYGHWLVESLPRLGLVAECHDLAACRFLVAAESGPIAQVYRDSLALFGIRPHQIVASGDGTRFCADLVYPAPLTVQPWVKAPRVLDFLERLGQCVRPGLPGSREPGPRKLYVSRNGIAHRRLLNEAALLPNLLRRGYVVVQPEELDFAEQVRIFREATHVVGNLGAALTNLAFAPRAVRLLALTSEFMQDDFFWDLVSQRGGSYLSLHGHASDPQAGMQSDFVIDPEALWPLLDGFDRDEPSAACPQVSPP